MSSINSRLTQACVPHLEALAVLFEAVAALALAALAVGQRVSAGSRQLVDEGVGVALLDVLTARKHLLQLD
jgi:hypothetical protein